MIELYFRPMACSLASRIALAEAGVAARYRSVDLVTKTAADDDVDFLAISPKGQVPVLVLEDGRILTEGAAVLQCIADLNPQSGLAPASGDPERYRLQEWLNFIATELHKAFLYPVFSPITPDEVKAHAKGRVSHALAIAAARLQDAPFLMGDRFTVADAYLIWALLLTRFAGIDLAAAWPSLASYLERLLERPHVRDAVETERQLLQAAPAR